MVKTAQLPPSVSSTIPMLSKHDCFLDLGRCKVGGDDWLDEEAVDLKDEVDRQSDAPCALLRCFLLESTDFWCCPSQRGVPLELLRHC